MTKSGARVLAAVLAVATASWLVASTLWAVIHQFQPLPYYDDWASVNLAPTYESGRLTIDRLFSLNSEHRAAIGAPRWIM